MRAESPIPTLINTTVEAVKQSLENFAEDNPDGNSLELSSDLVSKVSLALQEAIMAGAKAGITEYIQGFESDDEIIFRTNQPFRVKTDSRKNFLTIFGEITINRRLYYHRDGGPAVVPLDEAWSMEGRYATPEITEYILFSTAMLIPKDVKQLFAKMCPFKPSVPLIQDIINQDGAALGALLESPEFNEAARPVNLPDDEVSIIVGSMDGVNVPVREPGCKRGRPAEKPGKFNMRNSESSSYKNAMVGSILLYDQVEQIDSETGQATIVPNRLSSLYHARMPEPRCPHFKTEFEHSLEQVDESLPGSVIKILLMDGARSLWNYADNTPLYDDYIKVVDFFHMAEHLSSLAEALFGKNSDEAKVWYENWKKKIKHEKGAVEGMLRSVSRYQKANKLAKSRIEAIEKEKTFFRNNKHRMPYAAHVEQGLPIGSGPVEAACKTVVKARLCQSGMRWHIAGGQNVLNLRALQKSGQFDSAFNAYKVEMFNATKDHETTKVA